MLLIVIDLFSRYLHVRPLKNKTSNIVLEAFQDIFNNTIKPIKLRTDAGKEICNNLLEQYLKAEGICHHIVRNQTKANYAERCIKTLKGMLYRYFTKKRTYRYIDVLQKFASTYNATPHRSLNYIAPQDVNDDNKSELWAYMYLKPSLKILKKCKPSKINSKQHFFHSKLMTW